MNEPNLSKRNQEKAIMPADVQTIDGPARNLDAKEHRVELQREMANVVRANMEQVARTNEAAAAAQQRAELAQENNARLISALVLQAGQNINHFMRINLLEDQETHKVYLVGMPEQQTQTVRGL